MIYGVGCDILEITRIEKLYDKFGTKLARKLASDSEYQAFCDIAEEHKKVIFIAKIFAGKEAISKALGTGIGEHLAFTDISISNDKNGKPIANFTQDFFGRSEFFSSTNHRIHLSFSHEKSYLVSYAILEFLG